MAAGQQLAYNLGCANGWDLPGLGKDNEVIDLFELKAGAGDNCLAPHYNRLNAHVVDLAMNEWAPGARVLLGSFDDLGLQALGAPAVADSHAGSGRFCTQSVDVFVVTFIIVFAF